MNDTHTKQPAETSSWLPSLTEMVFAAVLVWLFLAGAGAVALLGDGDTGWHIRTGENILQHHAFPRQDPFSFSKAGAPWFAWEWLADVLWAAAHHYAGLVGVVLVAGILIAASSALLFRFMIWEGSNILIAVLCMLVASSASTIHWLARPHLFTYFLFTVSIFWLERDRRNPTPWLFGLAAVSALWTNLHGGFVALTALAGIYLAGNIAETLWTPRAERDWSQAKRYGALVAAVAGATLVNPYGYLLHQHILQYLRTDFILTHVGEFQPPTFRGEGQRHFEILLFAGLAMIPALLKRKDVTRVLLLLFWAHAAITSARHVLLYVVVAAPLVARELSVLWEAAARQGNMWVKTLQEVADDYGAGHYGSRRGLPIGWLAPAMVVMVTVVLLKGQSHERMRAEFPKGRFPVAALAKYGPDLAGRKVFTSDQWGDYLIYRYYPQVKVFMDGRSDFYGAQLGEEYLQAMNAHYQWEEIFDRHDFDVALVPVDWPLATTLKTHPAWKLKYDDGSALLLERLPRTAGETAAVADRLPGAAVRNNPS
jgi:hypothetical protein